MKTGSFRTFKGPGAVSIARSARGFRGPSYRELAPGPWFKSVSKEEYERRFYAQLERLDPKKVRQELRELTHPHEPVLMCWEVPPFTETNWCHRRMVASWLEQKLEIEVAELTASTKLEIYGQQNLFETEEDESIHSVIAKELKSRGVLYPASIHLIKWVGTTEDEG